MFINFLIHIFYLFLCLYFLFYILSTIAIVFKRLQKYFPNLKINDVLEAIEFVFDDNVNQSKIDIIEQGEGKLKKGVIHINENTTPKALIHEIGHFFRYNATSEDLKGYGEAYGINGADPKEWERQVSAELKKKRGIANTDYTYDELFANDFVRYVENGTLPNKHLEGVFSTMKAMLVNIVDNFKGRLNAKTYDTLRELTKGETTQKRNSVYKAELDIKRADTVLKNEKLTAEDRAKWEKYKVEKERLRNGLQERIDNIEQELSGDNEITTLNYTEEEISKEEFVGRLLDDIKIMEGSNRVRERYSAEKGIYSDQKLSTKYGEYEFKVADGRKVIQSERDIGGYFAREGIQVVYLNEHQKLRLKSPDAMIGDGKGIIVEMKTLDTSVQRIQEAISRNIYKGLKIQDGYSSVDVVIVSLNNIKERVETTEFLNLVRNTTEEIEEGLKTSPQFNKNFNETWILNNDVIAKIKRETGESASITYTSILVGGSQHALLSPSYTTNINNSTQDVKNKNNTTTLNYTEEQANDVIDNLTDDEATNLVNNAKSKGYAIPLRLAERVGDIDTLNKYADLDNLKLLDGVDYVAQAREYIENLDINANEETLESNLDEVFSKAKEQFVKDNTTEDTSNETKDVIGFAFEIGTIERSKDKDNSFLLQHASTKEQIVDTVDTILKRKRRGANGRTVIEVRPSGAYMLDEDLKNITKNSSARDIKKAQTWIYKNFLFSEFSLE